MFAVSYDPVAVLAAFAVKHGVTYTLLSDEGSQVIRALGLLNEHIAEQHAYYGVPVRDHHYGVPYPGTVVLDENGIVVEKRFEQSYRVRPTAVSFLEASFGKESTLPLVLARAETEDLQVMAWLGAPTYRPYQKLRLNIGVQIAPGLHVYGQPISDEYVPLTVTIDPIEALEVGSLELPEPRPFRIEGLDEMFRIFEGTIRGALPLVLAKNLGQVTLVVRMRYQACNDTTCYLPREVILQLPLTAMENIRD